MNKISKIFLYLLVGASTVSAEVKQQTILNGEGQVIIIEKYENGALSETMERNYEREAEPGVDRFNAQSLEKIEAYYKSNPPKVVKNKKDEKAMIKAADLNNSKLFKSRLSALNPCKKIKGKKTIKKFYKSKKLKSVYTCKDKQLNGIYESYHESGLLVFRHRYKNGSIGLR